MHVVNMAFSNKSTTDRYKIKNKKGTLITAYRGIMGLARLLIPPYNPFQEAFWESKRN